MEGLTASPLLLAAGVVAFAATVAILLPAWRASRMDPLEALRID
jgi:ABC-type antimicrobial peptide transport system permease subunit